MHATAKARWVEAQQTGASVLITACPQSYSVLSRVKPESMELKDIFELLNEHVAL
jgi:Fe-S oxidoreductase